MTRRLIVGCVLVVSGAACAVATRDGYESGVKWPEPPVVTPGANPGDPPSDAVVLFDGKDLSQWKNGEKWQIQDGYAIAKGANISTKQGFGTGQYHVEFATPAVVKGKGQGRGNNGFFLMSKYEVQILDSWENPTYFDGQCAAIYKQMPPMVNVSRKPGEWQSYDVVFEAPKFNDDGTVAKPAVATVFHNGVLVVHHFELSGETFFDKKPAYTKHPDKLPLSLFYHGDPVKFRNIWFREIKPMVGVKP